MKAKDNAKLKEVFMSESEDEDQDDARHYNLLRSIKKLAGKDRICGLRNEAIISANRIKTNEKITLKDLVEGDVTKDISKSKKVLAMQKLLTVPAHKGEQEKFQRVIGYDEAKKVLSKWDPVVKQNRKMKQMSFPLDQANLKVIKNSGSFNKNHEPMTDMEKEVAEILNSNQHLNFEKKYLSKAEQRALDAMNLAEAKERRAKLQRNRALMSYYGSKLKRDGKIKSKKHHRIMRKAKQKDMAKNLELLKDQDPRAYEQWLHKEETKRAEERMTLKHKGGSRRMKKQTAYGKYNKESRQAVQDMLQLGKERTSRNYKFNENENEESSTHSEEEQSDKKIDSKNPWLVNKAITKLTINEISNNESNSEIESEIENSEITKRLKTFDEYNDITSLKVNHEVDDVSITDSEDNHKVFELGQLKIGEWKSKKGNIEKNKRIKNEELIDLDNFLRADADVEQKVDHFKNITKSSIQIAFEDDNVFEDFVAEKQEREKIENLKDIDLTIPGWGDWTGPGIQISKKKKVPTATLR